MSTMTELLQRFYHHYTGDPKPWSFRLTQHEGKTTFHGRYEGKENKKTKTPFVVEKNDIPFVVLGLSLPSDEHEQGSCTAASINGVTLKNVSERHILTVIAVDMVQKKRAADNKRRTAELKLKLDAMGA